MSEKLFLLDPGYEGTLEEGEFRRRFASLNLALPKNSAGYGCCAILALLLSVVPLFMYFFTRDDGYLIGAGASAFFTMPLAAIFAWICSRGLHKSLRMRRLAWQGELVRGTVLASRRMRQVIEGSDFDENDNSSTIIAVEIEYRAKAPSGTIIRGAQARKRDDLLNADLPKPGTPVYVLVLNETNHALL
jgi:hypothetical protein